LQALLASLCASPAIVARSLPVTWGRFFQSGFHFLLVLPPSSVFYAIR
jgi:hypothetical protein